MLLAPKLHSEDELGSILDAAEFKKIKPTPQITATQSGGNEAKPQASVADSKRRDDYVTGMRWTRFLDQWPVKISDGWQELVFIWLFVTAVLFGVS